MKEFIIEGQKYWAVLAKATELSSVPPVSGVIRVTDYVQKCALTSDGKSGCRGYILNK